MLSIYYKISHVIRDVIHVKTRMIANCESFYLEIPESL